MLPLLLASPLLAALLLALLPVAGRRASALIAGFGTLLSLGLLLALSPAIFAGETVRFSVPWLSAIGLNFSLRIDGLAYLFALLVLGIGALIVMYAAWYLGPKDPPRRFFAFLMLFMFAMLGVVISGNLLLLVVFWELTSLSSFLLIGFWQHRRDAREGARMALTITGAGGLCLLAGVILLGQIVGSFELDEVLKAGPQILAHPLYVPTLCLILLGAFTKSAQFPFHFWLPHAMAAPTPVSAYLHSATMVKAGVFLLARLYPALSGSEEWFFIVSTVGVATLVLGAMIAIVQHDLKGLLAYSTLSHLGLITLLFGLGTPMAVVAGVFHILNHATFKASLFMAAGIIDHETGSRDLRKLSGLWKFMPITGSLAIVASLAMAGVPLLNGFLSKEMFLESALDIERHTLYRVMIPALALFASICAVAYSLRFIHDMFFNGEPTGLKRTPHEPPRFMRVPVELLVVLCLAVGILPNLMVADLLAVAAQATLNGPLPTYKLAIWHGFNLALLFSMIGLFGGIALYFLLQYKNNLHRLSFRPVGKRGFEKFMRMAVQAARAVTLSLETGKLGDYLVVLMLTILAAGFSPFIGSADYSLGAVADLGLTPIAWTLFALVVAGALATAYFHRQRVVALVALGITGLGITLGFVTLSAPDLALTQLLIEVVSILLLLLALRYLPQQGLPERAPIARWFHGAIALLAGAGVSALTYAVLTRPSVSVSDYFLSQSIPLGGGANAVNVIIVDFRAFDTLGEITVFVIAGLIIHALLSQATLKAYPAAPSAPAQGSLMLQLCAQLLLPVSMAVSLHLFMRGHNLPGGGFIAALVLAIGVMVHFAAFGREWVESRMRQRWPLFMGWGLLFATLTGLGSFFFGHPFLTSATPYVDIPLIGAVPFASALGFDTGVYLSVFGATVLLLWALSRINETPAKQGPN